VVYAAKSTKPGFFGVSLAVKFPKPSFANNAQAAAIIEEARAGLTLGSQRIARTYDVLDLRNQADWPPWGIVMEFFPATLSDVAGVFARERKRVPLSWATSWARDISEALVELSERGFVHRDITDRNIFFRMAPERLFGDRVDDLMGAHAVLGDLGVAGRCGQSTARIVYRQNETDPWKCADSYPLDRGENELANVVVSHGSVRLWSVFGLSRSARKRSDPVTAAVGQLDFRALADKIQGKKPPPFRYFVRVFDNYFDALERPAQEDLLLTATVAGFSPEVDEELRKAGWIAEEHPRFVGRSFVFQSSRSSSPSGTSAAASF